MLVGISTACLYPELCENSVKYLCENGVPAIEIFINSVCETEGKLFSEIEHIVKANGTRVFSVHPFTSGYEPFMIFSDYERRFNDGCEFHKRYLNAANRLGADIIVFHGDKKDSKNSDERYFERYLKLYNLSREYGVYLAQENVARCRSRSPEFISKMKNELGENVRFVLDLKQANRSEQNYESFAEAMGDKLIHIHINDCDAEHDCLLPGKGQRDFLKVKEKLDKLGYSGNAVIEVYRDNFDKREELFESLEKMKAVFD